MCEQVQAWSREVESWARDEQAKLIARSAPFPQLKQALEQVALVVADENEDEPDILGMFTGPPWGGEPYPGELGPCVFVYTLALVDAATREESSVLDPDMGELEEQVRITVQHELGHYLGMEHKRMHSLGIL